MALRLLRTTLGTTAVVSMFLLGASAPAAAATDTPRCNESGDCEILFSYTGSVEHWIVPEGASQVSFEVRGASGLSTTKRGGTGGALRTKPKDLNPGTRFAIAVGQGGQDGAPSFGGGASGGALSNGATIRGGGGGGGSFVFTAPAEPGAWQIYAIAGGGSGAANQTPGEPGGGVKTSYSELSMWGNGRWGTLTGEGAGDSPMARGRGAKGEKNAYSTGGSGEFTSARYNGFTLTPGTAGMGGYAFKKTEPPHPIVGSGSGGGGGYFGGGGGAGGVSMNYGYTGGVGGGGSGTLGEGVSATGLYPALPDLHKSLNGSVMLRYHQSDEAPESSDAPVESSTDDNANFDDLAFIPTPTAHQNEDDSAITGHGENPSTVLSEFSILDPSTWAPQDGPDNPASGFLMSR